MTKRAKILLPIAVVAAGLALAAMIVRARPQVERRTPEVPPPLVRVLTVEPRDLSLTVRTQGTVEPRTESDLVAEVAGRIERVSADFAEGAFFRRGQILVRIDPRDYELAVARAEATVAQAQVRLDRERAEAELARQEWSELGDGDPSPLTLREPQLAEARAALAAAEAGLEQARLQLERTAVRALYDGRVRSKRVDVGQFVSPGTALATVYSTETAELRLPVSRAELAYLEVDLGPGGAGERRQGAAVELSGEVGGRQLSWSGRVVRTGSEFDPKSRMLPLFVEVDDPFRRQPGAHGHPLPMGLFVEAEIAGRAVAGVAVLPREAVRDGDGGADQVLVVDAEDRLRFRTVSLLRAERDRVLVDSGLEADERVCVSPLESAVDGMRVRAVAAEPEPPAVGGRR